MCGVPIPLSPYQLKSTKKALKNQINYPKSIAVPRNIPSHPAPNAWQVNQ